jgi:EpsD family peptidyl-prolyl cis-trans isomerase
MTKAIFTKKTTIVACAVAMSVLTLSACGKKDAAESKTPTQVAAKVGSEEISVHQINQVLSRANTNGASPEVIQVMGREALEKLIDQQLAIDQATEAKLHRSPEIVAQIEGARRDILARAYIQQLTGALPKPTEDDAKKYFTEHPQLFAERRAFNVQELVAPPIAGIPDQLRSFASSGKPIEEVAAWLKGKGIKFNAGSATRTSEQIPLDLLPKIYGLKDGQSTVLETPQGVTFVRVVASQSAPVTQAVAIPRIQQFLTNQRANEAITANIKQLRSTTKITYVGEFATPLSKEVTDAASAPATAQAAAAAPAAATSAPDTANTANKDALEKGVAGLK